jgi:hypothetical protein
MFFQRETYLFCSFLQFEIFLAIDWKGTYKNLTFPLTLSQNIPTQIVYTCLLWATPPPALLWYCWRIIVIVRRFIRLSKTGNQMELWWANEGEEKLRDSREGKTEMSSSYSGKEGYQKTASVKILTNVHIIPAKISHTLRARGGGNRLRTSRFDMQMAVGWRRGGR